MAEVPEMKLSKHYSLIFHRGRYRNHVALGLSFIWVGRFYGCFVVEVGLWYVEFGWQSDE